MSEPIYIQLTPIPPGLRPPSPLELLAYEGNNEKPPPTQFLETEKAAFEAWSNVEPKKTTFNIVPGYTSRFGLFCGPVPSEDVTGQMATYFRGMIDDIFTGAVYGDTGTTLDGVPFSTRGRWIIRADMLYPAHVVSDHTVGETKTKLTRTRVSPIRIAAAATALIALAFAIAIAMS